MGVWGRVQEKLWTGTVRRDYGVIADGNFGHAKRTVSVVLAGKKGPRLFIRCSYRGWGSASVSFLELDREAVVELDAVIHDALENM
jgi:hypothetical protein